MKIIHKITLPRELHALALAWTQSKDNFDDVYKQISSDYTPESCPLEEKSVLSALNHLYESLARQFWHNLDKLVPEKFENNRMQCNPASGEVRILDELHDSEPDDLSLDKIMKDAGVQNVDDWAKA